MFCGKELRAFHSKNDCELEYNHMCNTPSEPAIRLDNCSSVPYNEYSHLYRICDFNDLHSKCRNLECCDSEVKNRGCSEPFPATGKVRYRLTLTANYEEERKTWYDDCLSHLKKLGHPKK
jgi:hypothetical protein